MPTVAAPYLKVLIDGARRRGSEVDAILRRLGIESAALEPDGRVDQRAAYELWQALADGTGDDAFGLHLAERVNPGDFAVLDYAARNASTLRAAYLCIVRYCRLIHSGAVVSLDQEGEHAAMRYTLPTLPTGPARHAAEFVVATWLTTARQMTKRAFLPLSVRFQHPQPTDVSEHRRVLDCRLEFNCADNALVFERSWLDDPVVDADPKLGALIARYAEELLARLPRQDSLANRVTRLLVQQLRAGDPGLETVAQKLGLSARTLQRRLRDEGTSHQHLLETLRQQLARQYLSRPEVAIGEVAFLLGFSEPSAFHRAFKRWTGMTPGSFRGQS